MSFTVHGLLDVACFFAVVQPAPVQDVSESEFEGSDTSDGEKDMSIYDLLPSELLNDLSCFETVFVKVKENKGRTLATFPDLSLFEPVVLLNFWFMDDQFSLRIFPFPMNMKQLLVATGIASS